MSNAIKQKKMVVLVGNEYKIIGNRIGHGFSIGETVIITDQIDDEKYYAFNESRGRTWAVHIKDLSYIQPPEELEIIEVKAKSVILEQKDAKEILESLRRVEKILSGIVDEKTAVEKAAMEKEISL